MYFESQFFQVDTTCPPLSGDKDQTDGLQALKLNSNLQAQAIVIGEHFLHPATDTLEQLKNNRTLDDVMPYFDEMLASFEKNYLMWLLSLADRGLKVLVLAAESSRDHFYPGWSSEEWDRLAEYYNERMRKIVEPYGNLFYMENNAKTAVGRNLESLLPDGIHKIVKNKGAVRR